MIADINIIPAIIADAALQLSAISIALIIKELNIRKLAIEPKIGTAFNPDRYLIKAFLIPTDSSNVVDNSPMRAHPPFPHRLSYTPRLPSQGR